MSDLRQTIWTGIWGAYGQAPTEAQDAPDRFRYAYWIEKWPELVARGVEIKDLDYAVERLMGMGAGGDDIALFGPYAHPASALHEVPPYPGTEPTPGPTPTPQPTGPTCADVLAAVAEMRAALEARLAVLEAKPAGTVTFPNYHADVSLQVPWLGKVAFPIVLKPENPS